MLKRLVGKFPKVCYNGKEADGRENMKGPSAQAGN